MTDSEVEEKKRQQRKEGRHIVRVGRRTSSSNMLNRGSIGSSSYDRESEVGVANYDDSIGHVTFDNSVNSTYTDLNTTIQATVSSSNSSSALNVMGTSAVCNSLKGALAPPRIITGGSKQDNTLRAASSLSSTAPFTNDDKSKMNLIPRIGMSHHHSGSSVCYPRPMMHPIYNNHHHKSNHFKRNIFVHPQTVSNIESSYYSYEDRNNSDLLLKHIEEKKELSQKVKELEYHLASQKEKYNDIKEELRDAKNRAQKAEWRLMKGSCRIM
jgi:hypothetical protein